MNKINKPLMRLIMKKKEQASINEIRNEEVTNDTI